MDAWNVKVFLLIDLRVPVIECFKYFILDYTTLMLLTCIFLWLVWTSTILDVYSSLVPRSAWFVFLENTAVVAVHKMEFEEEWSSTRALTEFVVSLTINAVVTAAVRQEHRNDRWDGLHRPAGDVCSAEFSWKSGRCTELTTAVRSREHFY